MPLRINEPLHLHVFPLYHLASIHDEFTRFDLEHAALDSLYEYSASYAIDPFRLARAAPGTWRDFPNCRGILLSY